MRLSPTWWSSVDTATRTPSTASTPTVSASTSTRRQTLAQRLLAAVYELGTVAPIAPEGHRYTLAEWRAYAAGYYFGIARALKVMDLAATRFAMYRRTRQADTKRRNQEGKEY